MADEAERTVPSNAASILGISGTMTALAVTVVAFRCWVRAIMLESFQIDDGVMALALIFSILSMVCFGGMVQHGAGHYSQDILPEWKQGLAFWSYIIGPINTTGICLVKISICFFLKRFVQKKGQKWFLVGSVIFLVIFMIYSILTFTMACIPLSAIWDGSGGLPGVKCWSRDTILTIGTVNAAINIATDVLFVLLPIPVITSLQVNTRTKVSLVLILSLGIFACAAAITRQVYSSSIYSPNYSWHYNFLIWFNIELNIGILAASLPALRPLFVKLLKNASQLTKVGYNSQGDRYGQRYAGAKGYGDGYTRQRDVALQDLDHYRKDEGFSTRVTSTNAKDLGDEGSEDGILPPKKGISKTTDIVIHGDR